MPLLVLPPPLAVASSNELPRLVPSEAASSKLTPLGMATLPRRTVLPRLLAALPMPLPPPLPLFAALVGSDSSACCRRTSAMGFMRRSTAVSASSPGIAAMSLAWASSGTSAGGAGGWDGRRRWVRDYSIWVGGWVGVVGVEGAYQVEAVA